MHQRVHQFGYGIGVGRDIDARAVRSHLVLVQPELGKPFVIDHLVHVSGLDLRKHVPVAIVVVTNIVVIEVRHWPAFVFGSEIFPVPLGDHDLAVGIERRQEQDDGVVQPLFSLIILGGGQLVGPLHGHLAGADLGGVNVAGEQEDGLALRRQRVDLLFAQPARVRQLARDLPVLRLVAQIVFAGDHRHEHVFAQRGLAQRLNLNAAGCGSQRLEVRSDLAIVGQLAVGPDFETKKLGRRWYMSGLGLRNFFGWRKRNQRQRQHHCLKTPLS